LQQPGLPLFRIESLKHQCGKRDNKIILIVLIVLYILRHLNERRFLDSTIIYKYENVLKQDGFEKENVAVSNELSSLAIYTSNTSSSRACISSNAWNGR